MFVGNVNLQLIRNSNQAVTNMKTTCIPKLTVRLSWALGLLASATLAWSHPYATALTNNAGTVSFRLNEAADNVKVIGNSGTLTNDLGAVGRGLTVTNLTSAGLTGGVFSVVVTKAGAGTPTRISDDANVFNQFERPTGVAVNKRPGSPYFGRIYVSNARTSPTGTGRAQGDGIYVLNADCTDAVGQGDVALNSGINFDSGGTSSPWRLRVGEQDDMVYATDWSDADGTNSAALYRFDPNISEGSGTNMFPYLDGPLDGTGAGLPPGYNHGSISEVYVTGSLATGDLTVYTVDEDYETIPGMLSEFNSLWRYDIGSADSGSSFPWSNAPNAKLATPSISFIGQTMGLDRGTNGYFYLMDQRSAGGQNGLQVIDPTGPVVLFESLTESMNLGFSFDLLSNCVSVAVSPDMKFLAGQRSGGQVVVVPLVDGIPNLAGRIEFAGIGSSARQIVFDAANNLYLVSNVTERMRVYSLGLTTTAITGSDGTFSLTTPATSVSVTADTDTVYESGSPTATAALTVVRANDALTAPLNVSFSTGGSAVRGADYVLQTNGVTFTGNSITIPAGADTVVISLVSSNDTTSELTESATFSITGTAFYSAGTPGSASVAIADDDANMIDISAVTYSQMYEGNTNDLLRYTLQRRGDTNVASYTVNLAFAGTATSGVDFTPPAIPPTIDPGAVTATFDVNPLNDTLVEGPETVLASVAAGAGYVVGTNNTLTAGAPGTIVDDDQPAETVLFADNFNVDSSANWTLRFSDINSPAVEDYTAAFAFDYSSQGIPPAPHSNGDTLGLLMTVNKGDASAIAAGLNAYPNGQSFSGNYALRCDMFIMQNASAGTTEYALFGINHSGNATNWFRNSGTGVPAGLADYDGIWAYVEADGAALGDYVLNTGPATGALNDPTVLASRSASSLADVFHQPPWTSGSGAGAPGNAVGSLTPSWCEVELSQINGVVTVKLNNTVVMTTANTTAYTGGNVMVGYNDAYDSIGSGGGGFVVFDNVRVISLGSGIQITSIAKIGDNVQMDFSWPLNDPASAFKLYSATSPAGPYAPDNNPATTYSINVPAASYRVVTPAADSARFFRIQHQ